jgi:hypothetical protein
VYQYIKKKVGMLLSGRTGCVVGLKKCLGGDFRLGTKEYPSTWDLMTLHYVSSAYSTL